MRCPFCTHSETQVVDSRTTDEGAFIRRRRQCLHCGKRFTTYERAEINFPTIVKKDGRRVAYQRGKLRASLDLALRKRPIRTEEVDGVVTALEEQLLASGARELPSAQLGEWVMAALRRLDQVAYVRFASVYRNFEDVDEFRAALDEAQNPH